MSTPQKRPRQTPVVATTSVEISAADARALSALHVRRTDNIGEATHLVAAHLARTEKMLVAIARGTVHIVTYDWIRAMIAAHSVVDAAPYALHDADREAAWAMRLGDALARSRARPGQLLAGHTFIYTRRIQPAVPVFRRIVEAAGGAAVPASGAASARALASASDTHHFVSCGDDRGAADKMAAQYAAAAADHGAPTPLRVWTTEVVLSGVLRQKLVWASEFELARE